MILWITIGIAVSGVAFCLIQLCRFFIDVRKHGWHNDR